MRFRDRTEAGKKLAEALAKYSGQPGVVYPLPRGGMALGVEIAQRLQMPIDLIIPRKVGHPSSPEYGIGAVIESGELVTNQEEIASVDPAWLKAEIARERGEARRRRQLYLGDRAPIPIAGKIAILVDDGIATGLTMEAAIGEARRRAPARLIVAIPVAPRETVDRLAPTVDEVVALDIPEDYLNAVGAYYDRFPQVTDAEVMALLQRSAAMQAVTSAQGIDSIV